MRALLNIIYSILVANLLISCDPTVQYTEVIENHSDHDLLVIFTEDVTIDSQFIFRNQTDTVFEDFQISSLEAYNDCWAVEYTIEAILVADSDSLEVNLDVTNPAIWKHTVLKKDVAGGGESECRLVIRNENIR